jgi:hypothetical protein
MASLSASTNPIVVDLNTGASNGGTTIHYDKAREDELWHRANGGQWKFDEDLSNLSGFVGDDPEGSGRFPIRLAPGEIYEFGIFEVDRGPLADPEPLAHLVVFAIARQPRSDLIASEDSNTGGTWHHHVLSTVEPTFALVATARRTPLTFDGEGYPFPGPTDGVTALPIAEATHHDLTTIDLLPGTPYTYLVVVIDDAGRWDYRAPAIRTLRRALTVQFETLHVYNDGDSSTTGEAKFYFQVILMNGPGQGTIIKEFERPESDVDDWSETDRPYPLGYAYIGALKQVHDGEQFVGVRSIGSEDDSPWGEDGAWGYDTALPLPVGPGEVVTDANLHLDCPPSTDGSRFHYGVDVVWSVTYEP